MTDRVPILSFPGDLDAWAGSERKVSPAVGAGTVTRLVLMVTDAPSGGSVDVELRTASGGGGSALSATIADATTFAEVTGSLTTSTGELWIRFPSASGQALNLSGWYEVESTVSITSELTTRSRVARVLGVTLTGTDQTTMDEIVLGVSRRMQEWMGREIVQSTYSNEKHDGDGTFDWIQLDHFPIVSVSAVTLGGTSLSSSDYKVISDSGRILYTPDDGDPVAWTKGRRNIDVSYDAGFASVPGDLADAATKQAAHEFRNLKSLGVRSQNIGETNTTYLVDTWLPPVRAAMESYRVPRAA